MTAQTPAVDGMWTCPFCKKVYCVSVNMKCDCSGWNYAVTRLEKDGVNLFTNPFLEPIPFTKYVPPSWDELFMREVYLIATKSKDRFTKIGSVLVKTNRIISEGYNGLCMNIDDNLSERHERPEKYFWYEHSERNCIFSAARFGISTLDSILYTNSIPCSDCTRAVIQSGIKEIVIHRQWAEYEKKFDRNKWNESCNRSKTMLKECNIPIRVFDKILSVDAYLDGKKIVV